MNTEDESDVLGQTFEKSKQLKAIQKQANGKVDWNPVKDLDAPLSTEEIVAKIEGSDQTDGSCASLALAYVANKYCGLDVTDYRGGASQELFSKYDTMLEISQMRKVKSDVWNSSSGVAKIFSKLQSLENDKEYILAFASHAAIVRNTKYGAQYLELQESTYQNGWKYIANEDTLMCRFVDEALPTEQYRSGLLIEAESIAKNKEIRKIMGYIQTSTNQEKGIGGNVK